MCVYRCLDYSMVEKLDSIEWKDIQLIVMYTIYSIYGYACLTGGFASAGTTSRKPVRVDEW